MTLSEELQWRGFVNQTTYKDITVLDSNPITFYWGVDPSADSMHIGQLAMAMMISHFIRKGHKAILLVGGATGLIGDPDGKAEERALKSVEEIEHNKQSIADQYQRLFSGQEFDIVDNYDWFKRIGYLQFLRDVGKHVPMRQMLGREFVQTRLSEDGAGISYAEFSYALIQGYDFLHLHREKGVSLQVCGADQWGNSIAGVELIRRTMGDEAHVWSAPLIINKVTGKKFGKSEEGAIWLDPAKTTPTQFYQFWINVDDEGVEGYLKVYTELDKPAVDEIMAKHRGAPQERFAQTRLAQEVTKIVHGSEQMQVAESVTAILTGKQPISEADETVVAAVRQEIPSVKVADNTALTEALVSAGLVKSNSEARQLLADKAIYINGQPAAQPQLAASDFQNGRLLLRKGKILKNTALIEQA